MLSTWLQRHFIALGGVFVLLLVGAFALIAILWLQLHQTRDDLERVESGAAFYALQVEGLRASLLQLEPELSQTLDEAIGGLQSFRSSTIEFPVQLEQPVSIKTELAIVQDMTVPVKTSFPINESLDTRIMVQGPLGIAVPVDVTVPVNLEVPVDLQLSIPIEETVPIEATVPVQIDLPVAVAVSDTELAGLLDTLTDGLMAVRRLLVAFGND